MADSVQVASQPWLPGQHNGPHWMRFASAQADEYHEIRTD
jgi:hypothetical protein